MPWGCKQKVCCYRFSQLSFSPHIFSQHLSNIGTFSPFKYAELPIRSPCLQCIHLCTGSCHWIISKLKKT